MSSCDICGGKIGFLNTFRCYDGAICKNCYRIVSDHYTSTIVDQTLVELKRRYIKNAQPIDVGESGFKTTHKIGSFILFDEKNCKFCILSNPSLSGKRGRPEIFPFSALERVEIVSNPPIPPASLSSQALAKDSSDVIQKLAIRLFLRGVGKRDITIIPSPVRASSYAFRKGCKYAAEIYDRLSDLLK